VGAAQAMQWGLIDFLVPDDEVDALALRIAKKIASKPPMHVAVAKQLCDSMHGDQIRHGLKEELLAISMLYKTEDRDEARAARKEGRAPEFRGI
jgi:enoyl-CoA hydratase